MKLTLSVDALIQTLTLCASVTASEKSDDVKNTIIEFAQNGAVTFIGTSPFITLKKTLKAEEYVLDNTNPIEYMTLKSKEILIFLSTYKGLNANVSLENNNNQVRCTVTSPLSQYGDTWTMDNLPLKNSTKHQFMNVNFPQECYYITTDTLKQQLSPLISVLKTDTSMYSYLTVGENHIIAFNPYYTIIQKKSEQLPSAIFTNIRIYHRYLSFMDKQLFNQEDNVYIARNERHLCFYFQEKQIQCYVIYDTKISNYQTYLNYFTKDRFVVLNRQLLTDGAKRAAIMKDDLIKVQLDITNQKVLINNTKYYQIIPVIQEQNMDLYADLSFNIMPKVFTEALLHKNSEDENVYMYYCPIGENEVIVLSDQTDSWFSLLRIKKETKS